jgi:FG-GAP-like repeat
VVGSAWSRLLHRFVSVVVSSCRILLVAAVLVVPAGAPCSAEPLFPGQAVDFGSGAFVTVGDFNGDGGPDLVVVGSSGVSISLGLGDGTFGPRMDYATGCAPKSVAVADFDGDGRHDLAVPGCLADDGSVGVDIFPGLGDGTLGPARNFATMDQGKVVALGDLNADSRPDLVVGSAAGLSVLLGRGDGTFEPEIRTSENTVTSIAVGDFDGDGYADLAVAVDGLAVLLGHGDGTFGFPMRQEMDSGIQSVATGDLNNDGHLDLVGTTVGGGQTTIYLGHGDGVFSVEARFYVGGNYHPFTVSIRDLNGDGVQDLAVVGAAATILLGHGDGTFEPPVLFWVGRYPAALASADFNADGRPDLVVTDTTSHETYLLLGRGDGTFESRRVIIATGYSEWLTVGFGDFDADGLPDLILASSSGSGCSVSPGRGDGTFGPAVLVPVRGAASGRSRRGTSTGTATWTCWRRTTTWGRARWR